MHPAWKPRGPEWATLAPGVRWLIKPFTGDMQAIVQARIARMMGSLVQSRADVENLGLNLLDFGDLADLDIVAGIGVYAEAVFAAELVVEAWEGMDDADGVTVQVSPEAIRAALLHGHPDGGLALMQPFLAWLKRPVWPLAADRRRLQALAKWEHGGGLIHCRGCAEAGAECAKGGTDGGALCRRIENAPQTEPGIAAYRVSQASGVWVRAGMGGELTGLDFKACLEMARAEGPVSDEGALVRCLQAIEAGALEAAAERAAKSH